MKRSPMSPRKEWMARSAMKRTPPRERTPEEGGDPVYLAFVRELPCCVCGYGAEPSHPHHMTGAGMALRAHDRETMPLCFAHHRAFHDSRGFFEYFTYEDRATWQFTQIAKCQELFAQFGFAHDVPQAAPASQDGAALVEPLHSDEY